MLAGLTEKLSGGEWISKEDARSLESIEEGGLFSLFSVAAELRERFIGRSAGLCAILNAKSGACTEDCSYCAQSGRGIAGTPVYPLMKGEKVIERALEARDAGVRRFSIVTSGRKAGNGELREIASMVRSVRSIGLLPCASLGLLNRDELSLLMDSGLERYHHNIETSERFFPQICSTHTYRDKVKTIEAANKAGLSVCSGGVFGLGESWDDRIEMAFALREAGVDSVPINFLIPVNGTPMEGQALLQPFEALKIISLYRIIMPRKEIRVCGGRRQILGELNSLVFAAGADSLLTGNYLTTKGTPYEDDLRLIRDCGLSVR
jgi:biotin synthase